MGMFVVARLRENCKLIVTITILLFLITIRYGRESPLGIRMAVHPVDDGVDGPHITFHVCVAQSIGPWGPCAIDVASVARC